MPQVPIALFEDVLLQVKESGIPKCGECDQAAEYVRRVVLPCGHGLCLGCFESLRSAGDEPTCPADGDQTADGKRCGEFICTPVVVVRNQKIKATEAEPTARGRPLDVPEEERKCLMAPITVSPAALGSSFAAGPAWLCATEVSLIGEVPPFPPSPVCTVPPYPPTVCGCVFLCRPRGGAIEP